MGEKPAGCGPARTPELVWFPEGIDGLQLADWWAGEAEVRGRGQTCSVDAAISITGAHAASTVSVHLPALESPASPPAGRAGVGLRWDPVPSPSSGLSSCSYKEPPFSRRHSARKGVVLNSASRRVSRKQLLVTHVLSIVCQRRRLSFKTYTQEPGF